jgi:hypothetical protein
MLILQMHCGAEPAAAAESTTITESTTAESTTITESTTTAESIAYSNNKCISGVEFTTVFLIKFSFIGYHHRSHRHAEYNVLCTLLLLQTAVETASLELRLRLGCRLRRTSRRAQSSEGFAHQSERNGNVHVKTKTPQITRHYR